jgi:hypothetical protein
VLADGQVERPGGARRERDGDDLAALIRVMVRVRVAALEAEVLDVGAGGFGDPQPVQGQQGDQGMLACSPEPGGDQQGAEFVAVQGDGMGLIVHPRTAHVRSRRGAEEFFLDRVICRTRRWWTAFG